MWRSSRWFLYFKLKNKGKKKKKAECVYNIIFLKNELIDGPGPPTTLIPGSGCSPGRALLRHRTPPVRTTCTPQLVTGIPPCSPGASRASAHRSAATGQSPTRAPVPSADPGASRGLLRAGERPEQKRQKRWRLKGVRCVRKKIINIYRYICKKYKMR